MLNLTAYLILAAFLTVIIGLGYLAYRRTKTSKDYMVGGGNNHPFLMAMAYGSTFISTSAIVGFGGTAAMFGMGLLWLAFCNIFVGILLAFIVFGKPTQRLGRKLNAMTFPELLGKHFKSRFIQKYASLIILLAMPLYASAVMIGAARFLETVLFLDYTTAVIIFAVIVAAYVITGGLKGIFYTDAFMGTLMFVGMVMLLVITYMNLGGITGAHQALTSMANLVPDSLAAKGHQGWTSMPAFGSEIWWVVVSTLVMGVGIGVLAQPQLIVRYLTVQGPKELNRAVPVGGIFILMMTGVAFVVGALTNVYFFQTSGQISLAASMDPLTKLPNIDKIIPLYINQAMPSWFPYVFLLTMLSAAMSTLSGQFHVMGTSLSYDLYKKGGLMGNRLAIIAALIVSVWLTFKMPPNIIAVATAVFFGLCAASFLPTYTAALFWPKATKYGAIASMVTGSVVSLLLMIFVHAKEAGALGISQAVLGRATMVGFPWTVIDPMVISLPIAAIVLVVVSLATQEETSLMADMISEKDFVEPQEI